MHNVKEMDSQRRPGPPSSLEDQPVQLSCLQAIPAVSNFSLSSLILQPEQAPSQTIYLKALTIPVYQPIQSECPQPNSQQPAGQSTFNLKTSNLPLILSPLVHSEGTDRLQATPQKPPQTINIVSGLPVLPQNPSPCAPLGSPGKSKSAGKYLCKHCGRDCLKPSVLEKHMRSHTGERPFPCTTCGIAFKTQSNLYKHRRTQTHVNNTRPFSESDGSSLLEENEKGAENLRSPQMTKTGDRNGDYPRAIIKQAISESAAIVASEKHPLSSSLPTVTALTLVSESQCRTMDNSCHGEVNQSVLEKETMKDLANLLQRRKTQEQKSPMVSQHTQLQRQQPTYPERLWDSKSPDYKLKKCESTDSGYLSRSDSVEQQMLSPSPLHSLCEHSTETEGDVSISNLRSSSTYHSKTDSAEKMTGSSALEKKKLEEHISKLISHNKEVVDDTQLDNVRPRKTVLSKQGSIDLPMPYTYKDSFHFDIRSLDVNRKKNISLCSAKSTFTPLEKVKPLFFHSVPTQFSTTIDCVPVTRSNSLPFVESTRLIQDRGDSSTLSVFTRAPPNTSFSGLLHKNKFIASREGFPTSHPRALVRQAAVDDLPLGNVFESPGFLEETKDTKKSGARVEGGNAKCKKSTQRKVKMFSQEKWQVYGDETFKKIYQKMKSSQTTKKQKGNKINEISSFQSDTKEVVSHERITGHKSGRGPTLKSIVSSQVAVPAKLNAEESAESFTGGRISQCTSQESSGRFSELMETTFSVSDSEHSEMPKTLELCAFKKVPNGNDQILSLTTSCELKLQLHQAIGQENSILSTSLQKFGNEEMNRQGENLKHVPENEDISPIKGEDPSGKESFLPTQGDLPLHQGSCGAPVEESQKLPSERKKLKVDELKSKENMLKICCGPNNPKDRIVKLLDQFKIINVVAPVSINHSIKEKKQTFTADTNSSGACVECEQTVHYPIMNSSNKDYIADNTASESEFSFSEQLRAEVAKEYICSSFHKLSENPDLMITGSKMSSQRGDIATASLPVQSLVIDHITPHLKKNEFLPKYILKYPKEGNSQDTSLVSPEELDQKAWISLPTPSNCKSLGTNPTDVCVCPLQLELGHPTRTKEPQWDAHTTWKSLVACSPAILETTSITSRVDRRHCHHQCAWQKAKVKEILEGAEDMDNFGGAQEGKGDTMVCSSYATGKKICFTSMYKGDFFISSNVTGRDSALKLICSGNSSVISVSSLVERAALCGNHDNKTKEWEADINSSPRLPSSSVDINSSPRLPTSSVDNSRCLCHTSDMLHCHVVCTPQKEVCTLPQLSMISPVGNSKIPNLSVSFPTLNAEPRLTWCCLTRNRPLPVEQKEKKVSAYSSLHTCKNEKVSLKCSLTFCKMKHTLSEGSTSGTANTPLSSFNQRQQIEKPYFSTAGGDELLKSISEQEKANKKLCKIRELTTISKAKRSRKRKKVKINQKRYKGSYGHRHLLLKTSRLSKQHWSVNRAPETPKKQPQQYIPDVPEHCGKCLCLPTASQGYDQNLQQQMPSCTTDEAASFVKRYLTKEGESDSGMAFSSLGSSSNFRQEDSEDGQVASRSINESSSSMLSLQTTATGPTTYCYTLPIPVMSQTDRGLNVCSLGKLPQELHPDMSPCTSAGICNFELGDPGQSHSCNHLCLETSRPVFDGSKADCKNIFCTEPKSQNVAVLEPPFRILGRSEQTTKGNFSTLHEKLPPVIQTPCYVSLRPKLLTAPSVSNICLPSSRHAQETTGRTDKNGSSLQLVDKQGKLESPPFKNPSAPLGSSGTPSKSYKKQTLEMMNKQTHVEEDTSSEDEDRLIIEI